MVPDRTDADSPLSQESFHTPAASFVEVKEQEPSIRIIPQISEQHRGLNFPCIEKKLPNGKILKVKRFVDKGNVDFTDAIAFRSKVVSRQHGEIWTEGKNFYFRDTKSSSGTFINNVRLSPPGVESPPIVLHDGDIIQLGIDYQGRTEDVFRCVRMRVELNREAFCLKKNPFRKQVLKLFKALAAANEKETGECCICLSPIVPSQALFIAPCCHSFHLKCCWPLFNSWPHFLCPLCRYFSDLNASTSVEDIAQMLKDCEIDDKSDVSLSIISE